MLHTCLGLKQPDHPNNRTLGLAGIIEGHNASVSALRVPKGGEEDDSLLKVKSSTFPVRLIESGSAAAAESVMSTAAAARDLRHACCRLNACDRLRINK